MTLYFDTHHVHDYQVLKNSSRSCCCCCSHINSHNQVRGHRTGSSHSGAEGKTQTTQDGTRIQGSPSGGGHVPPWGDASRMTTTDDDETCIYYAEGTNILAQVHI